VKFHTASCSVHAQHARHAELPRLALEDGDLHRPPVNRAHVGRRRAAAETRALRAVPVEYKADDDQHREYDQHGLLIFADDVVNHGEGGIKFALKLWVNPCLLVGMDFLWERRS
jgi:hypothetical protein